jgi:hypothetical protein
MTDDRDGIPIDRRWFRIGIALLAVHVVATFIAVWLLRVNRSLALVVILAGSVLGAWLLVYYFVSVAD